MKRRPLLLVVCDWNGTWLDDLGLAYGSMEATFLRYGLPVPSLATYQAEITSHFMDFYYAHGIPRHITPEKTNAIRKAYFENRWHEARTHRHTNEFLLSLRQHHIFTGLVSAEIEEVLKKRLNQFGIGPDFEKVIGDAWNKEKALRIMLDEFNFLPDEAVYVDDTFDGLTAAKNVGILPIGVTHGYHTPERIRAAQPDERYVANSFREVQRIIEREIRHRNK